MSYAHLKDLLHLAAIRRQAADACEARDSDDDDTPDTTPIDEAAE